MKIVVTSTPDLLVFQIVWRDGFKFKALIVNDSSLLGSRYSVTLVPNLDPVLFTVCLNCTFQWDMMSLLVQVRDRVFAYFLPIGIDQVAERLQT